MTSEEEEAMKDVIRCKVRDLVDRAEMVGLNPKALSLKAGKNKNYALTASYTGVISLTGYETLVTIVEEREREVLGILLERHWKRE